MPHYADLPTMSVEALKEISKQLKRLGDAVEANTAAASLLGERELT